MKILVIGGTNFIGPPVVRQLSAMGHEVTVFHRGKTKTELPLDVNEIIGDRSLLPNFKSKFQQVSPDVVLDMICYTEEAAHITVNAFKGIAQRVVAISSMDVYRAYGVILGTENDAIAVPITEDSPLRQQLYPFREMPSRPLNAPLDYDKILVERVVMASELPGTIVRLPMVYGENDPLHRLFPYIQRMDENRPVILLPESIAKWRGSYGYVENVAYGIALAVTDKRAAGRIYHVADLEVLTEAERIARVGEVAGWRGKIVIVGKEHLPNEWKLPVNTEQDWFVGTTRIRQELGYSEIISPASALRRTIDWERTHPPQESQLFNVSGLLDYTDEDAILLKLP
ncbi:MAG: NAD-dependent epimerase/dehydratase family protein [Heteroscytonema crispum UTEX LB 1556]